MQDSPYLKTRRTQNWIGLRLENLLTARVAAEFVFPCAVRDAKFADGLAYAPSFFGVSVAGFGTSSAARIASKTLAGIIPRTSAST